MEAVCSPKFHEVLGRKEEVVSPSRYMPSAVYCTSLKKPNCLSYCSNIWAPMQLKIIQVCRMVLGLSVVP